MNCAAYWLAPYRSLPLFSNVASTQRFSQLVGLGLGYNSLSLFNLFVSLSKQFKPLTYIALTFSLVYFSKNNFFVFSSVERKLEKSPAVIIFQFSNLPNFGKNVTNLSGRLCGLNHRDNLGRLGYDTIRNCDLHVNQTNEM